MTVAQLQDATVTANRNGKLTVTDPNSGKGTMNVIVEGPDSYTKTYTDPANNTNYVQKTTLKTGSLGAVTVKTTVTGGYEDGTYYLSSAETSQTSDFEVGQLPGITLGSDIENENGELYVTYSLAEGVDPTSYGKLTLTLTKQGTSAPEIVGTVEVTDIAANGKIILSDLKGVEGGTYDYTLTATAAYTVNKAPAAKTGTYEYGITQLDKPTLTVDTATGAISWYGVANADYYMVKVGSEDAVKVTDTTYTPALTAGTETTVTVTAGSASTMFAPSEAASVTVEKLPDITGVTLGTDGTVAYSGTYPNGLVKVEVTGAEYADGKVTFDIASAPTEVKATVTVSGGEVEGKYYIAPDSAASTASVMAGKLPSFEIESVTVDASGSTIVFKADSNVLFDAIDDSNFSVAIASTTSDDSGVSTSAVFDAQAGTLTATFGVINVGTSWKFTIALTPKADYANAGANTTELEYTRQQDQLAAPTNLKVEMVNGQPTLTWDAVEGATGYKVYKNYGTGEAPTEVSTTESTISIGSANKDVIYAVVAKGDGATTADSEASEPITVKKLNIGSNNGDINLTFNARAYNVKTSRVAYTLKLPEAISGVTAAQLKKMLQFSANVEGITITQNADTQTAYDVTIAEDVVNGNQQSVTLTASICGQLSNGTWVYSGNTAEKADAFKVGTIASSASVVSAKATTAKENVVAVQMSFTDLIKSYVNTTAITVTAVAKDGTGDVITCNAKAWSGEELKATFKSSKLTVGTEYTFTVTLPVKDANAGICSNAVLTFDAVVEGYTAP